MAHTRRLVVAAALPIAAALLTGQSAVAAADLLPPDLPTIGEIASGSAGPAAIDTGSAFAGNELGLGPSSTPAGHLGTGSAGQTLGLGARTRIGTGETSRPAPAPAAEPAAPQLFPEGSVELPDPHSDGARTACTGSVAVGGALILLGIVTGSSHGILGSSGSALGSAAVGSAAVGSGLACLLWPRDVVPPFPGAPLLLAPPAPALPVFATPPVEAPPPIPEQPTPVKPNPPLAQILPPPKHLAEAIPKPDPVAWNIMQLLTIMVVAILTTVRGVTIVRRSRHAG
ncbi:hypothetical protein OG203_41320 [Nocardia sp. NBC_01499]|uniref:hypothetical protein n=1 Tax=Nocardia sp. NBC_01499 TaxID=2903597 RepID=UPI003865FE3A